MAREARQLAIFVRYRSLGKLHPPNIGSALIDDVGQTMKLFTQLRADAELVRQTIDLQTLVVLLCQRTSKW